MNMKIFIGLMFVIVAVLAEKDPKLERKEKLKKKRREFKVHCYRKMCRGHVN